MNINEAATKIQSCWKGYKTKMLFRQVQSDFKDVCEEIDGSFTILPHTNKEAFSRLDVMCFPGFIFKQSSFVEKTSEKVRAQTEIKGSKDQKKKIESETEVISKQKLLKEEEHITMELFWVQQAIESRKNYFQFKNSLNVL